MSLLGMIIRGYIERRGRKLSLDEHIQTLAASINRSP
jgi:hypothetical protein